MSTICGSKAPNRQVEWMIFIKSIIINNHQARLLAWVLIDFYSELARLSIGRSGRTGKFDYVSLGDFLVSKSLVSVQQIPIVSHRLYVALSNEESYALVKL